MEKPKISEEQWGCIVPAILMIALIIAFAVGCYPTGAEAAEVQPSPSPTPDVVGRAIGVNVLGIIGAAVFVGGMFLLALRNMKKHEN